MQCTCTAAVLLVSPCLAHKPAYTEHRSRVAENLHPKPHAGVVIRK